MRPLLDNARYILRKLSNARSSKLKDNPASWQMLLLGVVRYPLDLALVTVGDGRHGDRVKSSFRIEMCLLCLVCSKDPVTITRCSN